ncbi:MAG TPA: hemerythrin domain-containing protein [Acidimicrobiales bacterium]|jgi:hypothetical protein
MERDDLYTLIHKVLRKGLFDLCVRAGTTDYGDPAAVKELDAAWHRFDLFLRSHSAHERDLIHPALGALDPGGTEVVDAEHDRVHELLDRVEAQLAAIAAEQDATVARRRGLELYRALNRLAGTALPHFDAEETELMPRLWALLSDAQIAAIRGAIMGSIRPEEAAYTVELAAGALNPQELEMIRANAAAVELAASN